MKILIAGDFCPRYELKRSIEKKEYESIFGQIKPFVCEADYSILNLECALADSECIPIQKQGPNLSCTLNTLEAIKYTGFNCVTLANNHFRDFGNEGCKQTLQELDRFGIDHVGGGLNIVEAQKILYRNIGNEIIAVVNFCEHEFSIATENNAGAAPMDLIDIANQIQEAKKNASIVIVIVHGGNEHYQLPSPRMKKVYRWFIDLGADTVLNHHQHCYSGYEIYQSKPIFYGLGNFCFDLDNNKKISKWQEGYLVTLDVSQKKISFEIVPYIQCREDLKVRCMSKEEKSHFSNQISSFNKIISDSNLLEESYKRFMDKEAKNKMLCLAPYSNKYLRYACKKGFIPSFISRQRRLLTLGHVQCESLRDVFINYLKKDIYE